MSDSSPSSTKRQRVVRSDDDEDDGRRTDSVFCCPRASSLFGSLPDEVFETLVSFCDFQALLRLRSTARPLRMVVDKYLKHREVEILQNLPQLVCCTTSTTTSQQQEREQEDEGHEENHEDNNDDDLQTTGDRHDHSSARATLKLGWSDTYSDHEFLIADALTYANPTTIGGNYTQRTSATYNPERGRELMIHRLVSRRSQPSCCAWIDDQDFTPTNREDEEGRDTDNSSFGGTGSSSSNSSNSSDDDEQPTTNGILSESPYGSMLRESYGPTDPGWGVLIKFGSFAGSLAWEIAKDMLSNLDSMSSLQQPGSGRSSHRNLLLRTRLKENLWILLLQARSLSILCGYRQYDYRDSENSLCRSGKEGALMFYTSNLEKVELFVTTTL